MRFLAIIFLFLFTTVATASDPDRAYMVMHSTSWCPPCQQMKEKVIPNLKRDGYLVKVIDVEKYPEEAKEYKYIEGQGVPQVVIIKERKVFRRFLGFVPENVLRGLLGKPGK